MERSSASPWLGWVVMAAAAVLFLARLGATDLWAPDEPRYGQIAAELQSMRHGPTGLVLLHLNDEPYTQKPPLYYWLAALFGAVRGGVDEVAARLPSALAAVALVALTLRFGGQLLGGSTGLLGAALLTTTFEFAHLARRAQLDVLLALFEMLALVAFWRADRGLGQRRANVALLHASMGLAVLTKGPVGFLIPVLVILVYLGWERRLRDALRLFPPWALGLSIGPGLAWIVGAVWLGPPGFFHEAVVVNLFGRAVQGTSHARPFYYFLYQYPVDLLPWTPLLAVLAWAARRQVFGPNATAEERRAWRFLLAWVGASFVFFTLSSGKRGLYMVPTFPAMALLLADATRRWLAATPRVPRALLAGGAVLGGVLAAAGVWLAWNDPLGNPVASRLAGAAVCALVLAAMAAWVWLAARRAPRVTRLAVALAAVWAIELVVFTVVYPALDPEKSPRPVAEAAARLAGPDGTVALLGNRPLAGGLVFYGVPRVVVLRTPQEVRAFFDAGGQVLVARERSLQRVEEAVPVRVHARLRSGRRALVVVTPSERGRDGDSASRPSG